MIERAVKNAWGSLESHLKYTHSKKLKKPEDNSFHKKCVEEYAELISDLSSLY